MTPAGIDETIEPAIWGDPVPDDEIASVETWLSAPIPSPWRDYLRRDRWLRRGWLRSGAYVTLEPPREARSLMESWADALDRHPGFYWLGTDGSRLIFCVDLRDPDLGVMVTDIAAAGWDEADPLGLSVGEFVQRIDEGTFEPDTAYG
ncbi:hypothetical protein [Nocardioides luteus]|uniref:Knr4/Smi1-like domain-containing protein n=1 Tax=Nocardioides luteus TaxID=1844 RepID=A0A1J4N3X2_9ACTN|nr:hypothetical protein [Nocardioides luteus]OIJ26227.1 hypothetical protein UG56_013340 [Nocardioides luteus]